jgi:hypothetical protein
VVRDINSRERDALDLEIEITKSRQKALGDELKLVGRHLSKLLKRRENWHRTIQRLRQPNPERGKSLCADIVGFVRCLVVTRAEHDLAVNLGIDIRDYRAARWDRYWYGPVTLGTPEGTEENAL